MSDGRDFNSTTSGSDQTDALQHARPISWRSECPLPEKAPGKLATAGNVGRPPFVMIVAGRPDWPIAVGNDPAKARCSQDFSADAVKVVTRQAEALSSGMSKAS